jgi:ABC-type nitrate/sulfonate/bicarbonate transport system substrate-binding protein
MTMKLSLGRAASALVAFVLAVIGGKAWAMGSPDPTEPERVAQRVAAIRAQAAALAQQDTSLQGEGAAGNAREQVAEWKKWKNY